MYSIQPHMHLRGKSMKYTAVYPDGREEVLLNVPHYDFNWQIVYEFAKPVTLPAGTTVRVEAAWDNSTRTSTTRGRTRRSSGASRAGTRCSARSSAAWWKLPSPSNPNAACASVAAVVLLPARTEMIRTHARVRLDHRGGVVSRATVFAQTSKLSFGKDVARSCTPKCAMCHRPGEVAPMSLMSYDEVRPWARAHQEQGRRPPDATVVCRGRPWQMAQRSPPRVRRRSTRLWRGWTRARRAAMTATCPLPPPLAKGWNQSQRDAAGSDHRSA